MNTNGDFREDILEADIEEMSVVTSIQVMDSESELHDLTVSDKHLSKPRRLSEILDAEKPLIPIPQDTMADTVYTSKFEPRCVLCKSPWRERAEHWYLENGRRPNAVVNFFRKYFNAVVSWECVDTHMSAHCTLDFLKKSGLIDLEQQESDMARWRYRELDLAVTGTLTEINEIRGMSCKGKPDLMMRRSQLLDRLYSRLVEYKRMRDEASVNINVDIFAVLMGVYQKVSDPEAKQILMDTVRSMREQ